MNHANICLAWMAHNQGVDRLYTTVGRGRTNHEIVIDVRPSAKGSRIRYDGPEIYSHHWWTMARFEHAPSGVPVVLYRDVSYSKSTGKHQYRVMRAVATNSVLFIPVPWDREGAKFKPTHDEVFNALIGQVNEIFNKALAARTKVADHLEECERVLDRMRQYAEAFQVPIPVWANPFEQDPARIEELEYKLTVLGIREGCAFHPFWRQA